MVIPQQEFIQLAKGGLSALFASVKAPTKDIAVLMVNGTLFTISSTLAMGFK